MRTTYDVSACIFCLLVWTHFSALHAQTWYLIPMFSSTILPYTRPLPVYPFSRNLYARTTLTVNTCRIADRRRRDFAICFRTGPRQSGSSVSSMFSLFCGRDIIIFRFSFTLGCDHCGSFLLGRALPAARLRHSRKFYRRLPFDASHSVHYRTDYRLRHRVPSPQVHLPWNDYHNTGIRTVRATFPALSPCVTLPSCIPAVLIRKRSAFARRTPRCFILFQTVHFRSLRGGTSPVLHAQILSFDSIPPPFLRLSPNPLSAHRYLRGVAPHCRHRPSWDCRIVLRWIAVTVPSFLCISIFVAVSRRGGSPACG